MTIGFWSKGCSLSPSKGRTGPGHCLQDTRREACSELQEDWGRKDLSEKSMGKPVKIFEGRALGVRPHSGWNRTRRPSGSNLAPLLIMSSLASCLPSLGLKLGKKALPLTSGIEVRC